MEIGTIVQEYVLPHWPFVVMIFLLAAIGKPMKEKVWTKERAAKNFFCRWIRIFLPVHAPITGALMAVIAHPFGGLPVSPGVDGLMAQMMYFAGAGLLSSYAYGIVKHYLKSRGIKINSA